MCDSVKGDIAVTIACHWQVISYLLPERATLKINSNRQCNSNTCSMS